MRTKMKRYLHVLLFWFFEIFFLLFCVQQTNKKYSSQRHATFLFEESYKKKKNLVVLFCVRIIKWRVLTTTTTTTTTTTITITTRDGECNRFETTFFFIHNKTRFRRFTISRTTMDEIFYPISTTTTRAFIRRRRA